MRQGLALGNKHLKGINLKTAFFKDNISFFGMSAPVILYVFVFSYLPMFGIILAFKNYNFTKGILGSDWVGFRNFEFFFSSQDAARVTFNTVYLNFTFIFLGLVVAVIVALLLYEVKRRVLVKFFQTTIIYPHFLSMVIVAYIVFAFLNPAYGYINTALESKGIQGLSWYSNPRPWPIILTIVHVWKSFGMSSIVYYAVLMGIDNEYFEASELDGANRLQQIWYISIPALIPVMTILTILAIGGIFRADFGLFYQVTLDSGALYARTDVIDTYVFRALRQLNNVGMSSAVGLFQSVVGFILIIVTNSVAKKIDRGNALF